MSVRDGAPKTRFDLGKRCDFHNEWTERDGLQSLFVCFADPDGTILELVETTRS